MLQAPETSVSLGWGREQRARSQRLQYTQIATSKVPETSLLEAQLHRINHPNNGISHAKCIFPKIGICGYRLDSWFGYTPHDAKVTFFKTVPMYLVVKFLQKNISVTYMQLFLYSISVNLKSDLHANSISVTKKNVVIAR